MNIEHEIAELRKDNLMMQKMLKSILQTNKSYHVVGGFCWGNTPEGASFLVLYPKFDGLKFQVCRVYADDYNFKDIPQWIRDTQETTGYDSPKDKDWAKSKKIYHDGFTMAIVTYDGKDTQMGPEKRYAGVLWASGGKQAQFAPLSVPPPTQPQAQALSQPPPAGACPECRAPEGKQHASHCSKRTPTIESLDDVDTMAFDQASIAEQIAAGKQFIITNKSDALQAEASEDWDDIPTPEPGQTSTEHTQAQVSQQAAQAQSDGTITPNKLKALQATFTGTFNGLKVEDARHWYIGMWTKKHTPDSVRSSAKDVTDKEADVMITELKKYASGLRKTWEAIENEASA